MIQKVANWALVLLLVLLFIGWVSGRSRAVPALAPDRVDVTPNPTSRTFEESLGLTIDRTPITAVVVDEVDFNEPPTVRIEPNVDLLVPGLVDPFYQPTYENYRVWLDTMGYTEKQAGESWKENEVPEAWTTIQRKRELQRYLIGYQERERARWSRGEVSVPLEIEIDRARTNWLDINSADPDATFQLLSEYSEGVINQIWEAGELAEDMADPKARWQLFQHLSAMPTVERSSLVIQSAIEKTSNL